VGSIHLLVQNVVLLNQRTSLPSAFEPPWFPPVLLSFLDGHAFLLHPFFPCKINTHYIFTCIAHSKRNYPRFPVLCTTSLIILHLSRHRVALSLFIFNPPSSAGISLSLTPVVNRVFYPRIAFPHKSPDVDASHIHEHVLQAYTVDGPTVITCRVWCPASRPQLFLL